MTLACSTVGASIYYRVGAQPKATDRFKYTQPFEISETSVIYAFAKLGELQSETISVTLTKDAVLTFAKAVDAVGVDTFELGGDDAWKVIENDGAKFDAACVQSGEIGDNQTSWFKATVQGAGTIRFWWKASCEEDLLKDFDRLVFVIDGHEFGRLDGITDWIEVLVPVQTTGPHTLMWAYVKDDGLAEGDDRGWVDGISWEPLAVVDSIPEINPNADAKTVQATLDGSADARLVENITDAATYGAYREWALKIGATDVKASSFAWASFATDSAALLAKMPTDDDLKVEEFKPSMTAGSFDFTVSVKDVVIGDKASVDNLKKLFGREGAESLESAAFSSENVSLDFKEPQEGKLKFVATPAIDNTKSFFMKMKVK